MGQKKILVVEDDKFFRDAICDVLKKKYQVMEASNGKVAVEIMNLTDFDLVLSDIQMQFLTGIELLEWTKKNKPVPFVVMTGFSMLLETKTAYELGASGFLAKPFKNAELTDLVGNLLPSEVSQASSPQEKAEYCKVSIDEFVARPRIEFDVYIKLSETKTVKLAHKGEEIPKDRISHYKEKGVKHLHILKEDFSKLVNFNFNLTKLIKERDDISVTKKLNFMRYTGEVLMEKVFIIGIDKESFKEAQTFMNMSMDVITESDEHLTLLDLLNSHSDHIYAHSLGVALFSVMVAKKLFFESASVLFKLMTAALYHDIGKKEIDRNILDKPRQMLNKEERRVFESHVIRGQEIIARIKGIHEDVARLVIEHHEDISAQGYPFNKKKLELHPLSRILQAVNIFMDLTLSSEGKAMEGRAALDYMEKIYDKRVDPEVIKALRSLLSK